MSYTDFKSHGCTGLERQGAGVRFQGFEASSGRGSGGRPSCDRGGHAGALGSRPLVASNLSASTSPNQPSGDAGEIQAVVRVDNRRAEAGGGLASEDCGSGLNTEITENGLPRTEIIPSLHSSPASWLTARGRRDKARWIVASEEAQDIAVALRGSASEAEVEEGEALGDRFILRRDVAAVDGDVAVVALQALAVLGGAGAGSAE
jgi:hypothetical protein